MCAAAAFGRWSAARRQGIDTGNPEDNEERPE